MSIVLDTVAIKRNGDRWMEKNMEGPGVYLSLSMSQSVIIEHHHVLGLLPDASEATSVLMELTSRQEN